MTLAVVIAGNILVPSIDLLSLATTYGIRQPYSVRSPLAEYNCAKAALVRRATRHDNRVALARRATLTSASSRFNKENLSIVRERADGVADDCIRLGDAI